MREVRVEPSRHHYLVVLGRAYRASGDPRLPTPSLEQLGSWLDQSRTDEV
jgi:hypothetical protein